MRRRALILLYCFSAAVIGYAQDVAVFPQLGHTSDVNSVAFTSNAPKPCSGQEHD